MIPYVNELFAKGSDEIWSNPTEFISIFSQGQNLLKSDILSVPIIDVYEKLIDREADLTEQWKGKSPVFILQKLLALDQPNQFLEDTLTGLKNLYMEAIPLVLVIPSPQNLLQWLHAKFQPNKDISIVNDDIEIASMYLAEYLQHFSNLSLSAIVISENEQILVPLHEATTLYQPILNVSRHYQWKVGLECSVSEFDLENLENDFDFFLLDNSSLDDISLYWKDEINVGGGLNAEFWINDKENKNLELTGLTYGEIPQDANPEKVLTQLKWLRS